MLNGLSLFASFLVVGVLFVGFCLFSFGFMLFLFGSSQLAQMLV